ncbi:MAG TPA: VOC family protein [Actinospica sp.]|nr:VOC family protein [Actinospica sp.]
MIRWSHAALNCRDLKTTEEFYLRHFGFERSNEFDLGDTRIVFLRLGEAYLELFGTPESARAAGPAHEADGPGTAGAVRHLAFQVDDVTAFLASIGEEAEVTLGPLDFSTFLDGWSSVWIRDPDGVIVEVSQGYRDGRPHRHDHAPAPASP